MKSRLKAIQLLYKFSNYTPKFNRRLRLSDLEVAKKLATICVDEILEDNPNIYDSDRLNHKYWKQVKEDIKNYKEVENETKD